MELQAAELQAGLDVYNKFNPVDFTVPYFLALPRHSCAKARQSLKLAGKGVSSAIDAKQRYVVGWKFLGPDDDSISPVYLEDQPDAEVAIIYREGRCKRCGMTTRSDVGNVVKVAENPPWEGRVARD